MDEREIQKILIEILYTAVNEVKSSPDFIQNITADHLDAVYHLAKKHDLAHIVSNFVYRNKIKIENEELRAKLQREEIFAVYRHERLKHAFEQICEIFDEACISYVPLKGSVLRAFYPYEHMRTSCDIDILIHEEDLDHAIDCLEKNRYRCEKRNYHDVSLYSPNKTHLELHFNIQENIDSMDSVLKEAWNHTELVKGSRYCFSKDFLVFHIYAHMAYHFISGGCGIRSLLDIWIMEHKMNAHYSCAENMLKKAGLYKFASEMCSIANKCFSYVYEEDAFSDLVLKYICSGGVYGTKKNSIAIQRSKKQNSFRYAFERLFLPYESMILLYPSLEKRPWLLPVYWIVRCVSAAFKGKTKRIVAELAYVHNVPDNVISELTEISIRLGI